MTRALWVLMICLGPAAIAKAEEKKLAPPYAFTKESPNKQWLFVMLPPAGQLKDVPSLYVAETKKLADKYPASGMYKNDGSTTPLWTADWYSFRVYPANDGEHLLSVSAESTFTAQYVAGRLPQDEETRQLDAPSVCLYEKGQLKKAYTLRELLTDPASCKHSVKHIIWIAGEAVDPSGTKLVLNTQDQNQYTFDMITGEILSQRKTGLASPRLPYILAGTLALVIIMGLFVMRVVKRAKVG